MRHAVLCLDDDILGQSPFQFTDTDMEHYNPDRILQPSVYNTLTKEEEKTLFMNHFTVQNLCCDGFSHHPPGIHLPHEYRHFSGITGYDRSRSYNER